MPRPRTAADVRQFIQNRVARPANAAPTVVTDDTTATIRLYDAIDSWGGWWGLSAEEMSDVVDSLPGDVTEIRLLVNSPGGDVFDGVAIANILAAHPARIVAVVQGLAASAASFIAARSDELVMNPGSMLMVHDASAAVWGWAGDMREMADLLDKISDNIAGLYATKAGGTAAEWRSKMLDETWYTADEAVEAGLADRVETPTSVDAPADADPDPEPASPFEDQLVRTVDAARDLAAALSQDDPDMIDPHPGGDVAADPAADDPTARLMAMRLALVTAKSDTHRKERTSCPQH